jgi:DNA helicase-2/ATP-dependent DNA helicase PcrA
MAEEAEIPQTPPGASRLSECSPVSMRGAFRLEAGAGAGKTYSLDKALRRLIDRRGAELRRGQQVGCITYTNVAKDEIISRIQAHPAVRPETIHGFCWSILQDFQSTLARLCPVLRAGRSVSNLLAALESAASITSWDTPASATIR